MRTNKRVAFELRQCVRTCFSDVRKGKKILHYICWSLEGRHWNLLSDVKTKNNAFHYVLFEF